MDKDKLSRLEAVRRQDTATPNYQWPTFRESGPLEHFGQIGIAFADADEALSKAIGDHADDVQRLEDNKADKTALQALQTTVNSKADSSTVTTLSNTVASLPTTEQMQQAITQAETNVVAPPKVDIAPTAKYATCVAIGNNAKASGNNATASGGYASASSDYASAYGAGATASSDYASAYGAGANVLKAYKHSVALGSYSKAGRSNEVSIGNTGTLYEGAPATRFLANVTDPELDQDATTKHYVDNAVAGKVSKTTIASLSDDADLATVVAKVNQILSALK